MPPLHVPKKKLKKLKLWFLFFQGKVYVYDKVFKPNATQEAVYNTVAKPIVSGESDLC